jgi:hypothetical protein
MERIYSTQKQQVWLLQERSSLRCLLAPQGAPLSLNQDELLVGWMRPLVTVLLLSWNMRPLISLGNFQQTTRLIQYMCAPFALLLNSTLVHSIGGMWIRTCQLVRNNQQLIYIFRGVLPFHQRKKLWDRHRAKTKKGKTSGSSSHSSDVVINSQVCMKSCPMYQAGAIGKIKNSYVFHNF